MKTGRLNLALLAGGRSGEREVSLMGAAGVEKALDPIKFNVIRYDPLTDLARLAADAAGNIDSHPFHGCYLDSPHHPVFFQRRDALIKNMALVFGDIGRRPFQGFH